MNGRNLTLEEYFEGKKEWDKKTKKEKDQCVRDRDTFNVYRGDSDGESSEDDSDESDAKNVTSQEETKAETIENESESSSSH